MGVFGNLFGGKKKDKIEIEGENLSQDEKMLLASWLRERREQGRNKLVEVDDSG